MARVKITLTIEKTIISEIDRVSKSKNQSRSRLVEEALKSWQQTQTKNELIEGYRQMAEEDRETAESHLQSGSETQR